MNYRHGFHAGNLADVVKHAALLELLRLLAAKDKPLLLLDTHAGRGSYDLGGEQALRTGEAQGGVLWLAGRSDIPAPLNRLVEAVRAYDRHCGNRSPGIRYYPGSPRLLRQTMRPGDRLTLCEMEPGEEQALRREFAGDRRVEIRLTDGLTAIKSMLPPPERRGVVLIDPPYERGDELQRAFTALAQGLRRFATGVFVLWYPVKDASFGAKLAEGLAGLTAQKVLQLELRHSTGNGKPMPGRRRAPLSGSGLIVVNPPWQFDETIKPMLAWLAASLGDAGAGFDVRWRKREAASRPEPDKRPRSNEGASDRGARVSSGEQRNTSRAPRLRRPPRSPRSA